MMFRRRLPPRVAVILGIVAVATAATVGCFGDEGSDSTTGPMGSEHAECDLNDEECVQQVAGEAVENADCDLSDPECVTRVATELGEKIGCELSDPECPPRVGIALAKTGKMPGGFSVPLLTTPEPTPSPERDVKVREILSGTEAIKAVLAGREEGRDYWIRISYVYEYMEAANTGEKPIAMVNLYFDPPLSYAGEVPVIVTDPCSGRRGPDERLDPDDPCMSQPKEYGTKYKDLSGAQGVVAQIDLRRGEIVDVFAMPVARETMEDVREQHDQ